MEIKYQNKDYILIISSEFPPGPGGIGTHAFSIANAFQKKGYNVIVNTISNYVGDLQQKQFDEKNSFKVLRFYNYNNIIIRWFYRIYTIHKSIKSHKIKKVFISGRFSIWVIPYIKLMGVKNITTIIHGTEMGKGIFFKWTSYCLKMAVNTIAVSKFTKSLIPHPLILRTVIINNGIDTNLWNYRDENIDIKNFPILLTVGSISFRKGQINVIKNLPYILKTFPNAHYHCVGNDNEKDHLLAFINRFDLFNKVTIHGILKHSELEYLYKISHINMMLSGNNNQTDYEGFGISVLEGNLFGVPAIGAKNSGLEDSIQSGITGELVDPENLEMVLKSLEKIFSKYNKYSLESKKYAKSNNWDNKILEYEKFIQ